MTFHLVIESETLCFSQTREEPSFFPFRLIFQILEILFQHNVAIGRHAEELPIQCNRHLSFFNIGSIAGQDCKVAFRHFQSRD